MLRPPHTSHVTQIEDIANLGTFKELLRIKNTDLLTDKSLSSVWECPEVGKKMVLPSVKLDNADLMTCVKGQWEAAFAHGKCLTGWAMVGILPFNRHVFWELVELEKKERALVQECNWAELQ